MSTAEPGYGPGAGSALKMDRCWPRGPSYAYRVDITVTGEETEAQRHHVPKVTQRFTSDPTLEPPLCPACLQVLSGLVLELVRQ